MSLVVAHLSDIHIHDSSDLILQKAKEISNAICCSLHKSDDLVIAITGDIAFSGKQEQYELAKEFLKTIADSVFENRQVAPLIIFCPGNHDCDFSSGESIRNVLLNGIRTMDVSALTHDIINNCCECQKNYRLFHDCLSVTPHSATSLYQLYDLPLKFGKVLVISYNTAWMSVLHEEAGTLLMPTPLLPNIDASKYAFIISMAHHPLGWLHPDNANAFFEHIRRNSDILLLGHEHRQDSVTSFGNKWNMVVKNGDRLQGSPTIIKSGFSVYVFDNLLQNLTSLTYSWADNLYKEVDSSETAFTRNYANYCNVLYPNTRTLDQLNDYGTLVSHFRATRVQLESLFCWPEIIRLNDETSDTSKSGNLVYSSRDEILSFLSGNRISLIIGTSLSGKTSLGKMIYLNYINEQKICLFIDAKDLVKQNNKNLTSSLEKAFAEQYSLSQIDKFKQTVSERKVLIVDNFEHFAYYDGQNPRVVSFLSDMFGTVILLSGSDTSVSSMLAQRLVSEEDTIQIYQIRYFGHRKRAEIIRKWFQLGNNGLDSEGEIDRRVDNAKLIIDNLIGTKTTFVPSNPITIVGVLQSINVFSGNTHLNSSQLGYLYDDLVRKSINAVTNDIDTYNILVSALSEIAYYMFINHAFSLTSPKLTENINKYIQDKILDYDPVDMINGLCKAGILVKDKNSYRFRYQYLYYYFAAKYMARHMNQKEIKEKVEEISDKLHIEEYGNIIIYICHFTNSKDIIENILIKSYCLFDNINPFDFKSPGELIANMNEAIEKALTVKSVGTEDDVPLLRTQDLALQDKNSQISLDKTEDTKEWSEEETSHGAASMISSLKTIEVLGQILRNYPGDIDGNMKKTMIIEINNLSMRVLQTFFEIIGAIDNETISSYAEREEKESPKLSRTALIEKTKESFATLFTAFARSLIKFVSTSLCSKQLILATENVTSENDILSLKLSLWDMKLLCLEAPDYDGLIKFNKFLKDKGYDFASSALQSIVASHLRHRHCGYRERDKLCNEFHLNKTLAMPNNQ